MKSGASTPAEQDWLLTWLTKKKWHGGMAQRTQTPRDTARDAGFATHKEGMEHVDTTHRNTVSARGTKA